MKGLRQDAVIVGLLVDGERSRFAALLRLTGAGQLFQFSHVAGHGTLAGKDVDRKLDVVQAKLTIDGADLMERRDHREVGILPKSSTSDSTVEYAVFLASSSATAPNSKPTSQTSAA